MTYTKQTWANGSVGGTPINATRLAYIEAGIEGADIVVNVKASAFGALGNGSANDTAAIQAAIDASPSGSTVFFPAGTYMVNATLKFREGRIYRGSHPKLSVIKQMNATTSLASVVASYGWVQNETIPGEPIVIQDLTVDGNKANNVGVTGNNGTCITLMNRLSTLERVNIINSAGNALRLVDRPANNVALLSGTCNDNTIQRCRIESPTVRGIWVSDNDNKINNFHLLHNEIVSPGTAGIDATYAVGASMESNYLSSVGQSAIIAQECSGTKIQDNYIEGFGTTASVGVYSGIRAELNSARGSLIANNIIQSTEPTSGSTYRYIAIQGLETSVTANIIIKGNMISGNNTALSVGLYLESGGDSILAALTGMNQYSNVTTGYGELVPTGGSIVLNNAVTTTDLANQTTEITSLVSDHEAADDPHSAALYAKMVSVGGGRTIYVQPTEPTSSVDGDLWIDTSVS